MNLKNERILLYIIRYTLPVLILLLSFTITTFLYYENKSNFENIKKETVEKFTRDKQNLIKEMVDNVYDYIIAEQKDTEKNLKESLISRVREAHTIIRNIYKAYAGKVSDKELIRLIRTAIKDIRFNNNRGYFFVYDKEATNIIHPLIPKLEGKSLINYQDTKGKYVLRESLDLLLSQAESYQEWYWRKSKTDMNEYKKIGFVKNIYELDWFIGTGEYVEDFSKDIQNKVLSQIDKFKFGKSGYIFAFDSNNIHLANIRKNIIGENIVEKGNMVGAKNIVDQMWETGKNGGGFVKYTQIINPIHEKPVSKVSYVRYIPEWKWLIGTGYYENEVEVLIQAEEQFLTQRYTENIQKVFLISLFVTIALIVLSFYISNIIEQKFKKYKEDIQHHIDENQKQYELLAQKSKLAAMGEMMENIAHQWRQPLSVITTVSSGVKFQQEVASISKEAISESMDSISHAAKHLSETIDDFRDFFKPDKEKSLFTIQNALDKTFKLLVSQLNNREIEVVENLKTITVRGYERELMQVLLNLLNNAKDALEECSHKRYLFIDTYEKNSEVYIQIKDNAGGIDNAIIKRVFEPYFTTKHQSRGTGLGLYMSREIITRHMHGSIEVQNSTYEYNGKTFTGAIFTIKLPKE